MVHSNINERLQRLDELTPQLEAAYNNALNEEVRDYISPEIESISLELGKLRCPSYCNDSSYNSVGVCGELLARLRLKMPVDNFIEDFKAGLIARCDKSDIRYTDEDGNTYEIEVKTRKGGLYWFTRDQKESSTADIVVLIALKEHKGVLTAYSMKCSVMSELRRKNRFEQSFKKTKRFVLNELTLKPCPITKAHPVADALGIPINYRVSAMKPKDKHRFRMR